MPRLLKATLAVVLAVTLTAIRPSPAAAASGFTFTGGGWGHGTGMSQWGTKGQADAGRSYQQILGHYYSSTSVGTTAMPSEVRVGVLWETGEVRFTATGPFEIRYGSLGGEQLAVGAAEQVWSVTTDSAGNFNLRSPSGQLIQRPGVSAALYVTYAHLGSLLRLPQTGFRYKYGAFEINTYSSGGRYLVRGLIGGMSMNQYLYGLGEVPSSWPAEAVKAQAVAGRTYATEKIRRLGQSRVTCNCGVYASTLDQAFVGYEKEAGAFSSNWLSAVNSTDSQVVLYSGGPIEAFYSSSSGGHTEHNENVFSGTPRPFLRGVPDPWDAASPNHNWTVNFSPQDLEARLNAHADTAVGALISVETLGPYGVSGRVLRVFDAGTGGVRITGSQGTKRVSGERIRSVLGLRSTLFRVGRATGVHPNGTLIQGSSAGVFRVEDGRALPIPSPTVLETWGGWDEVIRVSDDALLLYRGARIGYRDGSLIRTPDGTVWIISGGRRRGFTSGEVFSGLGYSWSNVVDVSTEEAQVHAEGTPVASIDTHPDGTVIQGTGAAVYWLQSGAKRPIPSSQVFDSWFQWAEVVRVTDARLGAYPNGPIQGYRPGSLLRTPDGVIWIVSDSQRRGFASLSAFSGLGYSSGNVLNVSSAEASIHPEGAAIVSSSEQHPNGTAVRGSPGKYFVMRSGFRMEAISQAMFTSWGYQDPDVVRVSDSRLASYSAGNPAKGFRDGTLLRTPEGTVWLISGAMRRGFTSAETFSGLGFSYSNVRDVSRGEAFIHAEGPAIVTAAKHPDGSLIKGSGATVYWMQGGLKRPFPSVAALTSWFEPWEIATTDDTRLNSYPAGAPIGFRDGTLIRTPDGTVWVISDFRRRGIVSLLTFTGYGYSWSNVRDVSHGEASIHPEGPVIT